jgi:hypothetical protein
MPQLTEMERELALFKKKAHDWNAEADRYLAQRDELLVALKTAVRTIRTWHGMGMGATEAQAWSLYQASPEMKAINAALAKVEGKTR